MTVREIQQTLGARVACGEEWLDKEVHTACGSDMMSDVLAFVKDQAVLITGLCNPQVIRTAEMMDINCGSCGAPTCKALAEDIVRGEAREHDCIHILKEYIQYLSDEFSKLDIGRK